MRNIKMIIEYDGSRYQGWQQPGNEESPNTISGRILSVLRKMTHEDTVLNCAIRTETGVHAYRQTVNFKTEWVCPVEEFKNYLNRFLPMDIVVVEAEEVHERFHAALNAKSRTYLYQIVPGDVPSVFQRKYSWHATLPLDVQAMKKAAPLLCGSHDFKCFSTGRTKKSTLRNVYSIEIEEHGQFVIISICASDFLHNMAKLIIGTLIDVGTGRIDADRIDDIFFGVLAPGSVCDSKGLILADVSY